MPVLIAPDPSTTAVNVQLDLSPIYDLFISLGTMTHPGERDEQWAARVKRDLSPQMREEADAFYNLFENRLVGRRLVHAGHPSQKTSDVRIIIAQPHQEQRRAPQLARVARRELTPHSLVHLADDGR